MSIGSAARIETNFTTKMLSTPTLSNAIKETMTHKLLVLIFLCAVFYGDVYVVRFVIPASMLLVPFVFITGIWLNGRQAPQPLLPAVALLLLLATIPFLQSALGTSPGKADLSLYLPMIYALATHIALSTWRPVSPVIIKAGIAAGAAISGLVMLFMIFVVPANVFLITGQVPTAWTEGSPAAEAGSRLLIAPPVDAVIAPPVDAFIAPPVDAFIASPVDAVIAPPVDAFIAPPVDVVIAPPVDAVITPSVDVVIAPSVDVVASASELAFYEIKNLARNALGRSNYLAAFFVFAFAVSLFDSRFAVALVMAALALATMSRVGTVALVIAFSFWFLYRRRSGGAEIAIATGLAALLGTATLLFWGGETGLPGGSSIAARAAMLQTAKDPIAANWLLGLPRSELMSRFGFLIEWSPHNSIATILAYFGALGLVLYGLYIFIGLRQIYLASRESSLWRGCFFGFVLLLSWSALEIIVLTPAFEILFACLTSLAWSANAHANLALAAANHRHEAKISG